MPSSQDRNLTRIKNETPTHSLDKQCMGNSNIFILVTGMEFSYGGNFISPIHQQVRFGQRVPAR